MVMPPAISPPAEGAQVLLVIDAANTINIIGKTTVADPAFLSVDEAFLSLASTAGLPELQPDLIRPVAAFPFTSGQF